MRSDRGDDRILTVVEAMREALQEEMRRHPRVFLMGEDIRLGGSFSFTQGMLAAFGPERVVNTPISESGFIGLAIGAAIQGMRPIVDFQYGDFLFCAMDQIVQQAAKLRYMSGGQIKIPMVIHLPTGASGRGAQHANSMEGFLFDVPGIKLVTPASPCDAKGLLKSAIRDDNVVIVCGHKHLYGSKGRKLVESSLSTEYVPEEEYTIPLGVADVKREGKDITVAANLLMLHHAMNVATALADEGINIEVVDPRTLVPLDIDTIVASVRKTGRLLIVEENNERGGWGAQVAAAVASRGFEYLKAPIQRVAAPDVPIPFSPILESSIVPGEERIRRAILDLLETSPEPLSGGNR
ncbi:MAG: alpha-ketoacid dehydrogenase subunit beta [Spirochaetaceae bacterium]|nr:MAG: alpha-ketoacid dehydrogenase subunit beta [Spirochaetaceae bacterium]